MSKFFKDKNIVTVSPDLANEIYDLLPPDVYILKHNPMMGFYLEIANDWNLPTEIYGDTPKLAERIIKTYETRDCNTGVLLSGEKGSGKTLISKLISHTLRQKGVPTIIINTPFSGDQFNKFMSDISQRCVVIFDEFEKIYNQDALSQDSILTLFDGVYNSNKLYLVTVNNRWKLSDYFLNRPGRLYYHIKYDGIEETFIREYCEKNLNNKDWITTVISIAKSIYKFNFDMLKAIVEESNIHNEKPSEFIRILNVDFDTKLSFIYDYKLLLKQVVKEVESTELHVGQLNININNEFGMYVNQNTLSAVDGVPVKKEQNPMLRTLKNIPIPASSTDDEDESYNEEMYFTFNIGDLVSMKEGIYTFEKTDEDNISCKLQLTKKAESKYDYYSAF